MMNTNVELIRRIKELYNNGENIIQYLRNVGGRNCNSLEDILISYDFQAGSYIKFTKENASYSHNYTSAVANVLNGLGGFNTLLEVGAGEATTLANVASKLKVNPVRLMGFDISWSRISFGIQYLEDKGVDATLFVADLFNMPFADNSIDILYTSHSIEPNGGKEKEALRELYRVTKKYLILLEPTNEFASEEGKIRMKRNGYVQDLKLHIQELGYNLTTYRPFEINANELNPTGLYIISKNYPENKEPFFCCPISKTNLVEYEDHYFSRESLISYPKIRRIPCLLPSYGILTSKHE